MRFLWLLLFCLPVLPVHALDVSVVDGQSRVNATLNQLQQRVETLSTAQEVNSRVITETRQDLDRFKQCGNQNLIYDKANNRCTAPPPDPAALSKVLECKDGEVIIQEAGKLVCKKRLAGCKVCYKRRLERDIYEALGPDCTKFPSTECVNEKFVGTQTARTGFLHVIGDRNVGYPFFRSTTRVPDICEDVVGDKVNLTINPSEPPAKYKGMTYPNPDVTERMHIRYRGALTRNFAFKHHSDHRVFKYKFKNYEKTYGKELVCE